MTRNTQGGLPLSPESASTDLYERARIVIPGGVNSATRHIGYPSAFRGAEGAFIEDVDGRRYVDYHAAFGAILLGHRHPAITRDVAAASTQHSLLGIGVTELEVRCAEMVRDLIPSVERSISTMSGTEATHHAVRLARAVTGRAIIVKFQGCFHGWHDAVARNVISSPERAYAFDPLSTGILDAALESTRVAEFNDLESVKEIFASCGNDVAAVILEPIPHNVGALLPDQAFLEGLRELTESRGSLLIFDEVITGFRHSLGGYQEICGVTPDLTTYGKPMGNGFPVAGLGGRADLMDQFSSADGGVVLAGTFNGNAVSMAAAVATMNYLQDNPEFYTRTFALGDRMRAGLERITSDVGIAAHVTGFGSVFVCYFLDGPVHGYRDLLRNDDVAYTEFHRRMTDHGHLMMPLALKRNHISGAHTEADIDATLDAAETVMRGMVSEGLLKHE